MIYTMFAYRDKDTESFNPVMLFPLEYEAAVETLKHAIIKGKVEDAAAFELYYLGTFDTSEAKFNLVEKVKVFDCQQYVREG